MAKNQFPRFTIVQGVSHLDHGLTKAHVSWIKHTFREQTEFFLTTLELPEHLPDLKCGLRGPIVGDDPIPEEEVTYKKRGERAWASRMVKREALSTRKITIIAGPHETENDSFACVLYTAFGGPASPQEPGDPGCKDVEASKKFWAKHALVEGEE